MKPANLFQMETAALLASRRTLCIKLAFPLLLGLPFVLLEMPLNARLAGLVILLVMVAFFGSSVAFVRRRREGRMGRLMILPVSMGRIMGDLLLAGIVVDLMQMGSVVIVFVFVHGSGMALETAVTTAGLLAAALLLLNVMGMALGYAMNENSEIHLTGGLVSGVIILFSGILPVPAPIQRVIEPVAAWNPLFLFAENMRRLVEGRAMDSTAVFLFSGLLLCALASALIIRGVDLQRLVAGRS
jgi:hypothetical protein